MSPDEYGALWYVRYANGVEKYFGTKKEGIYTPSTNATKYAKSQTKLNGAIVSLYEVEPKNYHKFPFKEYPTGSDWYLQKFVKNVMEQIEKQASEKGNGHHVYVPDPEQHQELLAEIGRAENLVEELQRELPKDPDKEADEELVGHIAAVQTAFAEARKILEGIEKAMDRFFSLVADADEDDPDQAEELALIARLHQKKFTKFNDAINDAEMAFEAIIENLEGA